MVSELARFFIITVIVSVALGCFVFTARILNDRLARDAAAVERPAAQATVERLSSQGSRVEVFRVRVDGQRERCLLVVSRHGGVHVENIGCPPAEAYRGAP